MNQKKKNKMFIYIRLKTLSLWSAGEFSAASSDVMVEEGESFRNTKCFVVLLPSWKSSPPFTFFRTFDDVLSSNVKNEPLDI